MPSADPAQSDSLPAVPQSPGHADSATALSPAEIDTLVASPYSGIDQRRRLLIRDAKAFTDIWASIHALVVPAPSEPIVDFTASDVVVLAMGSRPTGGYGIRVDSILHRVDTVHVHVTEVSPGPSCIVTQALTQPVLALRIPRRGTSVRFHEEQTTLDCG